MSQGQRYDNLPEMPISHHDVVKAAAIDRAALAGKGQERRVDQEFLVTVAFRGRRVRAMMAAEIRAGERAVSAATREAGNSLKSAWRSQITGAGLGRRLANTIRSETYPRGRQSLSAAALVWSKAPVIVGAHDTGPLIRSKTAFWLAIPTPAAGKSSRGGRITPGEWERRSGLRLRFVYRRNGPSLLVAEGRLNARGRAVASRSRTGRGVTTVPIFLLVPQVQMRKRLDLARDARAAQDALPGSIVANWVEGRL